MQMTKNQMFCLLSLLISFALMALLFPYATLDQGVIDKVGQPRPMDDFDIVIDMGDDFGTLTIIELMAHYLENPPLADNAVTTSTRREFGGC